MRFFQTNLTKETSYVRLKYYHHLRRTYVSYYHLTSAPDQKRGNRDNLGIIIHFSPLKHILRRSLEQSRLDGSNEGSCAFIEK